MITTLLGNLYGIGGNSVISRALGEADYEKNRRASVFSSYSCTATALVLSVVLYYSLDKVLFFVGASENTIKYAGDYLMIVLVLGAVPTSLQLTLSHLIRAEGASRQAGFGIMLGGVLNIILDPIFMFGLGMGFNGAALVGNFQLSRRKHMRVPIGNIDTLVTHSICDGYSRESYIDQQTDVAMTNSMDSYSFHSTNSATTAHFMMQIGFCKRKYTFIFIEVQRFKIIFHLIRVEIRHEYTSDTFLCFGWCNNIFTFGSLVGGASLFVGVAVGLVGMVMVALAWPVYNRTLRKERRRRAPEIIRLSDELMK